MAEIGSARLRALRGVLFALGLGIFPSSGALAANIMYLFSGMIEGTLDGQFFAAPVTIGTMGDPAAVVSGTIRCNNIAYASIIWGPSSETKILSPISIIVSNGSSYAGLKTSACAGGGSDWFHVNASQFGTYNLASALGPITTTGSYVNGGASLSTTDGTLVLTWQSLTAFEADVNQTPDDGDAVPAVSEWGLMVMLCGLTALGAALQRRRRP